MNSSHYMQTNNPILRKIAKIIHPEDITSKEVRKLIDFMINIGKKEPKMVGLAAPQVGFPYQIIIVSDNAFVSDRPESDETKENSFKVFITPQITYATYEEESDVEGCFSAPGNMGVVPRAKSITVRAHDENGTKVNCNFTGFTARVFQHEIDHINGFMYPDRIFRFHPESNQFHFLNQINDSPERQQKRLKAYQEAIKSWREKHGNVDGFVWPDTISKETWEQGIVQSKPDWKNDPVSPLP